MSNIRVVSDSMRSKILELGRIRCLARFLNMEE